MSAFLATAGSYVGSGISSAVHSLEKHPKDKIRLARNADMYKRALNGDIRAWWHLGVLSRRVAAPQTFTYGPYTDGWTGTIQAGAKWNGRDNGWATQKAADDAWNKYQSAASKFAGGQGGVSGNTTQQGTNGGQITSGNPNTEGGSLTPAGLGFLESGVTGNLLPFLLLGGAAYAAYRILGGK